MDSRWVVTWGRALQGHFQNGNDAELLKGVGGTQGHRAAKFLQGDDGRAGTSQGEPCAWPLREKKKGN